MPLVARDPTVRTLPVNKVIPSNPKMASEIFLELLGRQRERGNPVGEGYAKANKTYKNRFVQHGHHQLADNLPEVSLESLTKEQ